jgi:hypothetical protein
MKNIPYSQFRVKHDNPHGGEFLKHPDRGGSRRQ